MKKIFHLVCCFLPAQIMFAQDAAEFYKIADTLFRKKDFKKSAIAYADGIRKEGPEAAIGRYRSGAGAWALAGETDSAFRYLGMMASSSKVNKVIARSIEYGEAFISLNKDRRWRPVIDKINNQAAINGYLQEEFIYGRKDGVGLVLICIKPKVNPNGKGIVAVQSGGWNSNYNGIEVNTSPLEQYLQKGYTVFAVFHGSQPRYAIPDAINDLKRSIRYIRYNAAKFSIDPDHIGITGGSAGGHLSLAVALAGDNINATAPDPVDRVSSRVQAAAVLYPPTDLLHWGPVGNIINQPQLLRANQAYGAVDFKTYNSRDHEYQPVTDTSARNKIAIDISPLYSVTADDPPVFIIHGDGDQTVPLQQSQSIIARLKEAGVPTRFVIKQGADHISLQMNPEWQEFVDWFDKYLK